MPSSVNRQPEQAAQSRQARVEAKPFPWRSKLRAAVRSHQRFAPRSVNELDRHSDRLSMVARQTYGQPTASARQPRTPHGLLVGLRQASSRCHSTLDRENMPCLARGTAAGRRLMRCWMRYATRFASSCG